MQQDVPDKQLRLMQRSVLSITLVLHLLPNAMGALDIDLLLHVLPGEWLASGTCVAVVHACSLSATVGILQSKAVWGSGVGWLRGMLGASTMEATFEPGVQSAVPCWLMPYCEYDCSTDPELSPFICPIKQEVVVDPVITIHGQVCFGNS